MNAWKILEGNITSTCERNLALLVASYLSGAGTLRSSGIFRRTMARRCGPIGFPNSQGRLLSRVPDSAGWIRFFFRIPLEYPATGWILPGLLALDHKGYLHFKLLPTKQPVPST